MTAGGQPSAWPVLRVRLPKAVAAMPSAAWRLLTLLGIECAKRIPAFGLATAAVLCLPALLVANLLEEQAVGVFSPAMLLLDFAVAGLLIGGLLGFASAGLQTVQRAEEELCCWLMSLASFEAESRGAETEPTAMDGCSEQRLTALLERWLQNLPAPGIVRWGLRTRLRLGWLADYHADCQERQRGAIDLGALQEFLIRRCVSELTRGLSAQFQIVRLASFALAGLMVVAPIVVWLVRTL
jgi:hypothetical protein